MDEAKLADLNDIQDFFNRVGSARNSAFPIEKPHSNPIDVKDFIGWCNNPLGSVSKSPDSTDDAETLGNAIVALNQFGNSELDAMESALRGDTWDDWCETEWSKIRQAKKLKPTIKAMKKHPENAAFYLALRCLTDNQKQYHFRFDKSIVAKINAFDPFIVDEKGKRVLNQQWHVLISLLAFLDVAHALSNDRHECHSLYPYLSRYDKGDLNKRHLRLGWEKVRGTYCRVLRVVNINQDKSMGGIPPHSAPMMDWIEKALTGKLESENAQ